MYLVNCHRNRKTTVALFLGSVLVVGATMLAAAKIYQLHADGYCISQNRKIPEKEMFAKALERIYSSSPLAVETLQEIYLGTKTGYQTGGISASRKSHETLPSRIDRLLEDPSFVKACCKWGWEKVDYLPPNRMDILLGTMPKGIVITRERVTVEPSSISPQLRDMGASAGHDWASDYENVSIVGPIRLRENANTTVPMDVCGEIADEYYSSKRGG